MNDNADLKINRQIVLFTAYCGFFAFGAIALGSILSAWYYSGRTHEPYSFFNHFISELGNKTYSSHAYFFNGAMQFAGLPIVAFMIGIFHILNHRIRYVFIITGVSSGLLCILLGHYSSDHYYMHIRVALAQFNAMLLSSVFFSIAVIRERENSYFHPYLAYMGAIPILFIIVFLGIECTDQGDTMSAHTHALLYHRPAFWALPFVEWMVFFSLIVWIAVICVYLLYTLSSPKANVSVCNALAQ